MTARERVRETKLAALLLSSFLLSPPKAELSPEWCKPGTGKGCKSPFQKSLGCQPGQENEEMLELGCPCRCPSGTGTRDRDRGCAPMPCAGLGSGTGTWGRGAALPRAGMAAITGDTPAVPPAPLWGSRSCHMSPCTALHPDALCIHRSSCLLLPQGSSLSDYLIYQAFIC